MASDKFIGFIMTIVGIAVIFVEAYYLIYQPIMDKALIQAFAAQYWALAIPVFLAVLGLFLIVIWIGYTMMTTPPPEEFDFEEFEKEIQKQEEKKE